MLVEFTIQESFWDPMATLDSEKLLRQYLWI